MLEPYYDSYVAMIQMAGGVRRPVTLRAPDFRLDLDELAGGGHADDPADPAATRRTTRPAPCSPARSCRAVADVAIEHDLVVVTDEVYEHLTYDAEHVPLATLPGMFERTLTLSSAGKSYSFTGWKVGWATGPADLVGAVLAAKQWLTFTSGAPLQPAVAHALDDEPDFPQALAADLRERRNLLCGGLALVGLEVFEPQGTYFVTTSVARPRVGRRHGVLPGAARARRRGRDPDAGVLRRPEDRDAGRHLVRWAFCKTPENIAEGLGRLAAADLRGGSDQCAGEGRANDRRRRPTAVAGVPRPGAAPIPKTGMAGTRRRRTPGPAEARSGRTRNRARSTRHPTHWRLASGRTPSGDIPAGAADGSTTVASAMANTIAAAWWTSTTVSEESSISGRPSARWTGRSCPRDRVRRSDRDAEAPGCRRPAAHRGPPRDRDRGGRNARAARARPEAGSRPVRWPRAARTGWR